MTQMTGKDWWKFARALLILTPFFLGIAYLVFLFGFAVLIGSDSMLEYIADKLSRPDELFAYWFVIFKSASWTVGSFIAVALMVFYIPFHIKNLFQNPSSTRGQKIFFSVQACFLGAILILQFLPGGPSSERMAGDILAAILFFGIGYNLAKADWLERKDRCSD
ncbi:MAG: hypothetical protein OIF56_13750 [Cohaesibacter sp.]|nr:hypothetical protein [Cohaesibacter sp.]